MNTTLNVKRVLFLLRNEILIKWKIYLALFLLSTLLSIFAYIAPSHDITQLVTPKASNNYSSTITSIITPTGNVIRTSGGYYISDLKYHLLWFPQLLCGLGIVFTSLTFWEYRPGNSRSFHIGVPASLLEKYLAKLILTTFIFPLIFLICYQLYARCTYQLGPKFGIEFVQISWLDPYIWKYIAYYQVIQSIIMVGSIYFTKYSLIKTLISLGVISFLHFLLMNFIGLIRFDDYSIGTQSNSIIQSILNNPLFSASSGTTTIWISAILLISTMFVIVYYKFQELEA